MNNCSIKKDKSNTSIISDMNEQTDMIIINIDGKEVQTKDSFFKHMEEALSFPEKCNGKYARFEDSMTDLSWLPQDRGICIIINGYDEFLKNDLKNKTIIEEIFKKNVIPFWTDGVTKYVKGGKPRKCFVIET